jgi:hypothetical protein
VEGERERLGGRNDIIDKGKEEQTNDFIERKQ